MSLFQGYLVGLAMVVFVGPVVFYLLKTSLEYGKTSGMLVVFGILFSDIVAGFLCFWGVGKYLMTDRSQMWLSIGGGLILIGMGVHYLRTRNFIPEKEQSVSSSNKLMFFVNGFLVNFVNPFVFAVWIGVAAFAAGAFPNEKWQMIFLIGALAGILTTDSAKVLLAAYLKKFMQSKSMLNLYRIAGAAMILFALRLLYHGLSLIIVF